MRRMAHCLLAIVGLLGQLPSPFGAVSAVAQSSPPDAMGILRGLENTRTDAKPFRVKGVFLRVIPGAEQERSFAVEYEKGKYRIASEGKAKSVVVFDGTQLFSYDGKDSAVITTVDRRVSSGLAFDPRSLGISTGLYSDLTLEKNIAYHSGTDVSFGGPKVNTRGSKAVTIELTDQYSQRIRFDVQPNSPFRVHYYSKTIPLSDGGGIFSVYVTETEYWPDDADGWLPRKLVMYSLPEGKPKQRVDEAVVEFEKPEFVSGFDPETWTEKGLSMPFGQPLADLRIKQRVGYWNGIELVESLPASPPGPLDRLRVKVRSMGTLEWVNVAVVGVVIVSLCFLRRRSRQ